jgi:MSHA biogenesis protein MshG
MPVYHYKARNANGSLIEGNITASNSKAVANIIANREMIPVSITEQQEQSDVIADINYWLAVKSLKIEDLILFSRQMYSLIKAGVPIVRAIRSLAESSRNPALAQALREMSTALEGGLSLSQALRQHPKIFSPLFVSIISVGESTGSLEIGFQQISQYLDREKETQTQIKSALRYPSMVIIAISVALAVVNIYVIPAFKGVFDRLGADLPWQTKLLVTVSDFSVAYWHWILGAILLTFVALKRYVATPEGQLKKDELILKIPAVGSIIHRATMERFSRSFAMVLESGVPLVQGISIVANALGNTFIGARIDKMRIGIEKGDSISRMAMTVGLFPPLVIQMILVGEETGNIGDMLIEVADFYESEIKVELKNLSSAIEPILIVFIGIIVLILALGIFLPMWNLSSAMR